MKPGFFFEDNSDTIDPMEEGSDVDHGDTVPSYFYRIEFQARGISNFKVTTSISYY